MVNRERLAYRGSTNTEAVLLRLQASAGNQAVLGLLGQSPIAVQRQDDPGVITVPEVEISVTAPASLRASIGSEDYYLNRFLDFSTRNGGGYQAPDYYLGYGDKYVRRFKTVVRWQLSRQGQAWLDQCLILLQGAIENRRDSNPFAFADFELQNDAFREFAYNTHADAYVQAGICDLPMLDWATIATTPDVLDILTLGGIKQIGDVFLQCQPDWFYPRGPAGSAG